MTAALSGRRVLVVEDSPLIAGMLEDILKDLGCVVVGPTGSMAIALELAANEAIDAGIVDVNIRGGKVFPAAETLESRGIPFILASGYADWTLPEKFQSRPRLLKPFSADKVEEQLTKLFGRGEAGA